MNKVVDVIALEKKVKERTEAERKAVAKNLRSIREEKKYHRMQLLNYVVCQSAIMER